MDSFSLLSLKSKKLGKVPIMIKNRIDIEELNGYLTGYWLSDFANFSSYIAHHMENVNWVGFYLSDGKQLRLGPFHGRPACLKIPFGQGLCGRSFMKKSVIIADDVDRSSDHIRCDSESKSEMVLPLTISDEVVGVLDVDSPVLSRFNWEDREMLELAIKSLAGRISRYSGVRFGSLY